MIQQRSTQPAGGQAMPLPPDDSYPQTPESIERNRIWNLNERRQTARRLMDQTSLDVVRVLGLELEFTAIDDERRDKIDGIETLSQLVDKFGADLCQRWLNTLTAMKKAEKGQ